MPSEKKTKQNSCAVYAVPGRTSGQGGVGEGAVNCQSKQQKLEQEKEKFYLFST